MPSVLKHSPFFFVSPSQVIDGHLLVEGSDARHLALVRRAKPNDKIRASDGRGRVFEAAIETIAPQRISAAVLTETRVPRPLPAVTVFQGLAKQSKIDVAVQKMSELGIDRIAIFVAGRSVQHWDDAKKTDIERRWQKISYEASKQSHQPWLPEVVGPLGLDQAVQLSAEAGFCLVADPAADRTLREALGDGTAGSAGEGPGVVGIVVGPEGGLTPEEIAAFCRRGAVPVSIGDQILRTETAGLAIAAMVMYHLGRLG